MTLGKRGLTAFLAHDPGTQSGIMILQYSAAAIVSRNKVLSHPSSTDSMDSSAGQEDHVSMGSLAAVHTLEVLGRIWTLTAMEWMAAVRAIEQQGVSAGSIVDSLLAEYRQMVPSSKEDVIIADEIRLAQAFIEGLEVEDPELLRFSI